MSAETEPGHGNSPAAWTGVTIMLVAFAIGTVAFWFDLAWLVWASAGLLLLGLRRRRGAREGGLRRPRRQGEAQGARLACSPIS